MRRGHVFRVLVHIDSVEDLMFYHYPPDELETEGRRQFREFNWEFGRPDGDMDEDFQQPQQRYCRINQRGRYHPRDDDDEEDRERQRPRTRDILTRVTHWFDGRGRSRSRVPARNRGSGWYRGESSRQRRQAHSPSLPPSRGNADLQERRALKQLWVAKNSRPYVREDQGKSFSCEQSAPVLVETGMTINNQFDPAQHSDAIQVQLQDMEEVLPVSLNYETTAEYDHPLQRWPSSDVILIQPTHLQQPPQSVTHSVQNPVALQLISSTTSTTNQITTTNVEFFHGEAVQNSSGERFVLSMESMLQGDMPDINEDQLESNIVAYAAGSNLPPLEGQYNDAVQAADNDLTPSSQTQGELVHPTMEQFISSVTSSLPKPVLQNFTIKQQKKGTTTEQNQEMVPTRASLRLKEKATKQKSTVKMAQEVLAKKWGIITNDQELEGLTLQQYLDIYKKPIGDCEMSAIKKLTEVAEKKKKHKIQSKKHLFVLSKKKKAKKSKDIRNQAGVQVV